MRPVRGQVRGPQPGDSFKRSTADWKTKWIEIRGVRGWVRGPNLGPSTALEPRPGLVSGTGQGDKQDEMMSSTGPSGQGLCFWKNSIVSWELEQGVADTWWGTSAPPSLSGCAESGHWIPCLFCQRGFYLGKLGLADRQFRRQAVGKPSALRELAARRNAATCRFQSILPAGF